MNRRREDDDTRLERLRAATTSVRARGDFAVRVTAAVARERPHRGWFGDVLLGSWGLVPLALAAALCLGWAFQSQGVWNDAAGGTTAADAAGDW